MNYATLTVNHKRLLTVRLLGLILLILTFDSQTTFGQESGTEEDAIKGLSSQDDYVRMHAALALGKLKSSRAVRPLITALESDSKKTVRGPAAWALGEIRDKQAIGPLTRALSDKDELVKASAAAALVNFGDDAVRMILRLLPTFKDDQVRVTVIRVIKDIGKDAIGPLIDELGMGQEDATREESAIFAALFLAKMGKEAVVPLIAVLENDTVNATAKWNAMWCLSEINDKRAVEPIRRMMKSRDSKLKDGAAKVLQKMGETTNDR